MQMTEKEICDSYRNAVDQKKQVKILAELNATDRRQIAEILEANGFKIDRRVCNDGRPTEPAQSTMSEAAKQARRDHHREWNRKNKEKVKEQNARYWETKAALRETTAAPELIEKLKTEPPVLVPVEQDGLAALISSLRGTGAKMTIEVTL